MKTIEKDNMPFPVATSLLANNKRQLSNRMRKNCHAARDIIRVSETVPQELEVKLDRRMPLATAKQLLTWSKRATERRRILQRQYTELHERLGETLDTKTVVKLKQMLSALTAAVNRLDAYKDACDDEFNRRISKVNPQPDKFLHPRRFRHEFRQ